jgi:hypothetical protein
MISVLVSRLRCSSRPLFALALLFAVPSMRCSEPPSNAIGPGTIIDARDEDGGAIRLRIDAVEKDPNDKEGDVFLYDISYQDSSDGAWKRYCQPDREGKAAAIPLQGFWNATRDHVPASDVITFTCTNSPLTKCVRLGYKPWKTVNGVSLRDHHLACARMMRADYCGDGRAHTREGTRIHFHDRLRHNGPETTPDFVFEAAWGPNGAVYVHKARYGETLESLVAQCPDRLRGHTRLDAPGLDEEAIANRWPEALLFNASQVIAELP